MAIKQDYALWKLGDAQMKALFLDLKSSHDRIEKTCSSPPYLCGTFIAAVDICSHIQH